MALQDMIAAAEKRANESEGEDKTKAEAELSALKSVESAGYTKTQEEINALAGTARSEGKESGKKEAHSELLKSIGVSDEDDEEEVVKAIKEWRDGQKTEADRLKGERDSFEQSASSEKERADKAEAELKRMRVDQAIANALDEAGFKGKRSLALRAIDRSKVEIKDDGTVEAKPAAEALREDEPSWFGSEAPKDPSDPPRGDPPKTGETAADRFNERLKRRGRAG